MDDRTCCTCLHWQGGASTYMAGCAANSAVGRTPFDGACRRWQARPVEPRKAPARATSGGCPACGHGRLFSTGASLVCAKCGAPA